MSDEVIQMYKLAAKEKSLLKKTKDKLKEQGWKEEDFEAAKGGLIGGAIPIPGTATAGGALGARSGRRLGGGLGAGTGSMLQRGGGPQAKKTAAAIEKVAEAYDEAYLSLLYSEAAEKVASAYGDDLLPEYEEALIKEAILGSIGNVVTSVARRGLGKMVGRTMKGGMTSMKGGRFVADKGATLGEKAMAGATNKAWKGVDWMSRNKKTVGGLAMGGAGAGIAGAGALAGRR